MKNEERISQLEAQLVELMEEKDRVLAIAEAKPKFEDHPRFRDMMADIRDLERKCSIADKFVDVVSAAREIMKRDGYFSDGPCRRALVDAAKETIEMAFHEFLVKDHSGQYRLENFRLNRQSMEMSKRSNKWASFEEVLAELTKSEE